MINTFKNVFLVVFVMVATLILASVSLTTIEGINLVNISRATSFLEGLGYSVYANGGGGNVTTFLELTDTPVSFTGEGGKVVKVKGTEDALEFASESGGTTNFTGLTDTPADYSGYAYQVPQVAANETELEFAQFIRGATYFIAASDATLEEQSQADILVSGTASDEIQTIFNIAGNSTGGRIALSSGTFTWADTQVIYAGDNLTLEGQGDATILDISATTTGDVGISIAGAYGDSSILTANADKGDTVIAVTDGTKFAAGNWVRLRSEGVWPSHATQKRGELGKVASVAGNNVTLTAPILDDYTTADTATLEVATMRKNITIKNLKIVSASETGDTSAIYFDLCHHIKVENVTLDTIGYMGVRMRDVVDGEVTSCHIIGIAKSGSGYGVKSIDASQNIRVHNNYFENCRHVCDLGGAGYGINRHIIWEGNNVVGSTVYGNEYGAFRTHGSGENVLITGNTVVNDWLASLVCPYTTVSNNRCINLQTTTDGIVLGAGVHHIDIVGNDITCTAVAIDFSSTTAEGWSHINISHNKFRGYADQGIHIVTGGTRLTIEDNDFDMADSNNVAIMLLNSNGTTVMSEIVIKGNRFTDAGDYPIQLYASTANITKVLIANNVLDTDGWWGVRISDVDDGSVEVDDVTIEGNIIIGSVAALQIEDYSDRIVIRNNTFVTCTVPYDIGLDDNANSFVMIMGNWWYGCTNDGTTSGVGTTFLVTSNVDKAGAWEAGDDPG